MKTLVLSLACLSFGTQTSYRPKSTPIVSVLPPVFKTSIKLNNSSDNETVKKAIEKAYIVLNNEGFYELIARHNGFEYTSVSPQDIAKFLKESKLTLSIRLYEGKETTTAYVSSEHENTIFLNVSSVRFKGGKHEELASTIIHELVHSVDAEHKESKFGHGGNSADGKDDSAPYWIGNKAKCFASGRTDCNNALALTTATLNDPTLIIAEGEELDSRMMRYH